jgi:arylsulfatase A-like enzyme
MFFNIALGFFVVVALGCEVVAFPGSLEEGCTQPAHSDRLNVVVLVADDQRWDSLGAAGNTVIHTPNLDQLAKTGIRFRRAYVTTSICMTSRASILTGQYMSRHGIDRFGKPLTQEQFADTYAGRLKAAGYYSGFVGKYGVGEIRREDFDFARSYLGEHWLQRDGRRVHVTEQNALDATEFLNQRPKDRPFQLSVSFFAPHAEDGSPEQYLPQPWSATHYENKTVAASPMMKPEYLEALPPFLRDDHNEGRIRFGWRFNTDEKYRKSMINYYRLITEVDEAVGRIIKLLKEQGVYENTLIVYIGDNGYFHGDRGLADKWYPYEESIRVPLLIHDPRLTSDQRGKVIDKMVLNIDLAPTILAAAGINPPKGMQSGMQGADLAPLLLPDFGESPDSRSPRDNADEPVVWREEFFYEHPTISNRERIPASQAVVGRDFKYIHWPEWDHEQLFDLKNDPTEKTNLAADPNFDSQLQQHRKKLAQWKLRVR